MSKKEELQNALKDAMRDRDTLRKNTLRMALTSIKLAEVDQGELDDSAVLAILQKEVKSRMETIEDAKRSGHSELIETSEQEISYIKTFLPDQLSSDDLEKLARDSIDEVGAESMREMGQVMKVLVPRLQGRATGGQASDAVRRLLG